MSDTVKIILIFAIVLPIVIGAGLGFLVLKGDLNFGGQSPSAETATNQKAKPSAKTRRIVIYIADMDCKTAKCAVKAREALQPIQGVLQVQVDGDAKTAVLTVDKDCSEGALIASLRQAGFDDARIR